MDMDKVAGVQEGPLTLNQSINRDLEGIDMQRRRMILEAQAHGP